MEFVELFLAEFDAGSVAVGFGDRAPVGDADVGGVGAFEEEFLGVVAVGLEAAEFGGAFVEQAMGLSAGAVKRTLDFFRACVVGFEGIRGVVVC